MLATIIKTSVAEQVSIAIMDAFVSMRRFLYSNRQIFERLTTVEYKLIEHDDRINELFNIFNKKELINQKIFFDGEVYDACSLLISLIMSATKYLILIDNYVDINTLNMLSKNDNNIKIIIYTLKNTKLKNIDINKYNQEYHNLEVRYTSLFHDRFLIIDNINLYHIGASIKDAGKKCFGINRMEDISLIKNIINILND